MTIPSSVVDKSASSRLDYVQYLRAIAALMVVFGHILGATYRYPDRFGQIEHLRYAGGAGVDIFFLISGFIMVFASRDLFGSMEGARDFILRRFIRIVPPYWSATAATLLILLFKSDVGLPSVSAIIASFFFIPYYSFHSINGFPTPVLDLGWTLNYEIMFYAIFALCIPLGRACGVGAVTLIMCSLAALGSFVLANQPAPYFWTRGIVLEFVAGMLIGILFLIGRINTNYQVRVALILVAIVWYFYDPVSLMGRGTTPNDLMRVVGWGLPAALLLVAAVSGPIRLKSKSGGVMMLLGDASYVLYLIHPFILILSLQAFKAGPWAGVWSALIFIIGSLMAACAAAIVIHLFIERPAVEWLTLKFRRAGVHVGATPIIPAP